MLIQGWHRRISNLFLPCAYVVRNAFTLCVQSAQYLVSRLISDPGLVAEWTRQDSKLRLAVPPHKRLAIALHWLGRSPVMDDLARDRGVGKSTASNVMHATLKARKFLAREWIKFPVTEEEVDSCTQSFQTARIDANYIVPIYMYIYIHMRGFQCVWGQWMVVIVPNSSPIRLMVSAIGAINTFVVQQLCYCIDGVVDGAGRFMAISTGMPALAHDYRVLREVTLYKQLQAGGLLPQRFAKQLPGTSSFIRPYIAADSAFRLLDESL